MSKQKSMASFRLSARAQELLGQTADAMSAAGPLAVSKTDVLELAIAEWCQKKLKKLSQRIDNVKT